MPVLGVAVWMAVAAAVGVGVGRLWPSARRRPRHVVWWPLLVAGLGARAAVEAVDVPGGIALLMASYGMVIGFTLANLAWIGTPIVALGLAVSATVVSLNGGMPVDPTALEAVGRAVPRGAEELPGERHLELPRDRLVVLTERIPVPLTGHVTDFGTIIATVGLANVAYAATARRRRSHRRVAPATCAEPATPATMEPWEDAATTTLVTEPADALGARDR